MGVSDGVRAGNKEGQAGRGWEAWVGARVRGRVAYSNHLKWEWRRCPPPPSPPPPPQTRS
ncbi:hypothetical protein E2C01_041879 [Portunus trituberculatus]|uniref:Uncharacterized protein n=1 Tax=Portunus trituberculatus TaxID=210409 RepID=A0A5B7FSV2_PORTR|nr:hypothetical protein [Portunus trituberculatus]